VKDPRELREPGLGLGRDPVRTPMPWDASPNAGFTAGAPWLPLNADWPTRNHAELGKAPDSLLNLYRRLLRLRRSQPALAIGDLAHVEAAGDILAYERHYGDERLSIALNLGSAPQSLGSLHASLEGRVLLSTIAGDLPASPLIVLRPHEGVIVAALPATAS
jgi:alpha-glucosidase